MTTCAKLVSIIIIVHVLFTGVQDFAYGNDNSLRQADTRWYEYEPSQSTVTGVIEEATKYGPPNYGENPETDQKLTYYYLRLDDPINVKGNPNSDLDRETFTNVKLIQIILLPGEGKKHLNLRMYLKKRVKVWGRLFQAEAGRHFTDVLMEVEKVTPIKK